MRMEKHATRLPRYARNDMMEIFFFFSPSVEQLRMKLGKTMVDCLVAGHSGFY
jgi:hypothetical protein